MRASNLINLKRMELCKQVVKIWQTPLKRLYQNRISRLGYAKRAKKNNEYEKKIMYIRYTIIIRCASQLCKSDKTAASKTKTFRIINLQ